MSQYAPDALLEEEPVYTPYEYNNTKENTSWAGALPVKQGLYDPDYEKDACGVGFSCHIKGKISHKIISDAQSLLCNMTHRGAVGSDARDGDGAGVMTSIPHKFMVREFEYANDFTLPPQGQYAVGNLFFKNDQQVLEQSRNTFEQIADCARPARAWLETHSREIHPFWVPLRFLASPSFCNPLLSLLRLMVLATPPNSS